MEQFRFFLPLCQLQINRFTFALFQSILEILLRLGLDRLAGLVVSSRFNEPFACCTPAHQSHHNMLIGRCPIAFLGNCSYARSVQLFLYVFGLLQFDVLKSEFLLNFRNAAPTSSFSCSLAQVLRCFLASASSHGPEWPFPVCVNPVVSIARTSTYMLQSFFDTCCSQTLRTIYR